MRDVQDVSIHFSNSWQSSTRSDPAWRGTLLVACPPWARCASAQLRRPV
jgi:hypothetical protein